MAILRVAALALPLFAFVASADTIINTSVSTNTSMRSTSIGYCDQHRLSVSSRLGVFRQVLDAVDYAHQCRAGHLNALV